MYRIKNTHNFLPKWNSLLPKKDFKSNAFVNKLTKHKTTERTNKVMQ